MPTQSDTVPLRAFQTYLGQGISELNRQSASKVEKSTIQWIVHTGNK